MNLAQAVRTMLLGMDNNVVQDSNIIYGTRNQFTSLPAVTFQINDNETLTIGESAVDTIRRAQVTIKSYAKSSEDAVAMGTEVEDNLSAGTYSTVDFMAVLNKNSVLEEPTGGFGEEANPYVVTTTSEIYYKG